MALVTAINKQHAADTEQRQTETKRLLDAKLVTQAAVNAAGYADGRARAAVRTRS